jgi:hypothetical protein
MNDFVLKATDPLGTIIQIPDNLGGLAANEIRHNWLNKTVQATIEKPMYMLEIKGVAFYYIRSLGWENTMLVEAVQKEGLWQAIACYPNPTPAYLRGLLKEARLLTSCLH